MRPLQTFSTSVIAGILRRQPSSAGRTSLAWQLAVGHDLARATAVELRNGTLTVTPRNPHWGVEIQRAGPTILERMQALLGADVREITVRNP